MGGLFCKTCKVVDGTTIKPNRYGTSPSNYASSNFTNIHSETVRRNQLQHASATISPYKPEVRRNQLQHASATISPYKPEVFIQCNFDKKSFPSASLVRDQFLSINVYKLRKLTPDLLEHRSVKERITNRHFLVDSIEKIYAPFLKQSYLLRKQQMIPLEELELFHGTKIENAHSICMNNFNWRFNGKQVGHRFGHGVNFSCNAMYAANYSRDMNEKVMFIAKVMIGKRCKGRETMKLPDPRCDTSVKQDDNIVIVKYQDNEFYPIYLIKFHISPKYVPNYRRNYCMELQHWLDSEESS